jgi:GNAT superfamily N-acetyltransferase
MNDCSIREAKLTDAPAIARLVTQLGYPTSSSEMENRLQTLLAHSDYITLVAEVSSTVVGLVGAYVGHAIEFTGTYGRLTVLVVDEQWRGHGIGKALMGRIERWLRGQGATRIVLTSGKQRAEAHRFYERLGYSETGVRFVKRLS